MSDLGWFLLGTDLGVLAADLTDPRGGTMMRFRLIALAFALTYALWALLSFHWVVEIVAHGAF